MVTSVVEYPTLRELIQHTIILLIRTTLHTSSNNCLVILATFPLTLLKLVSTILFILNTQINLGYWGCLSLVRYLATVLQSYSSQNLGSSDLSTPPSYIYGYSILLCINRLSNVYVSVASTETLVIQLWSCSHLQNLDTLKKKTEAPNKNQEQKHESAYVKIKYIKKNV